MTDAEKDSSGPRDLLQARPSRRATVVWTLLFFVVAFGIRLSGIGWGLPTEYRHQSLHPDEPLIKMHADDKPYFRPGFYSYGTSYLTFLKVAADAGRAYGWVRHGDDVPDWQTDRDIHLTGRVLSAIAGAATVVVVFLLLLRLTGLLGAGLGAMAMALAPGHVVHSQFQTTDVFATLLIALSAWLIVRFLDADALRPELSVAGLGIVAGLAAGTKYSGAVMILPAFAAIYLKARPQFFRLSVPLCAAFLLGFVVATPGILLEPAAFWDGFTYEVRHAAEGHGLVFVQTPSGFIYHVGNLVASFGLAPLIIGLIGLGLALIRRERWSILLIFAVVYYVMIGGAEVKFVRYVFPLLPFLAVGLGYLAGECHRLGGWKRILVGVVILVVGFSARGGQGAFGLTHLMRGEDPRDQAATWLAKVAGEEKSIGFVTDPWFYSPPLFPDTGLFRLRLDDGTLLFGGDSRVYAMRRFNPNLIRYGPAEGLRREWDQRLLREMAPDYVVFSSFEFIDHDRVNDAEIERFIERLVSEYDLAAVFWGRVPVLLDQESMGDDGLTRRALRQTFSTRYPLLHDLMYIQPTICVFQRKPTN